MILFSSCQTYGGLDLCICPLYCIFFLKNLSRLITGRKEPMNEETYKNIVQQKYN